MRAVSSFSPSRRAALQRTQLCLAISALLVPVWSFAAPVVGPNGGVSSGTATIVQNGAVTDINQSSNKAVINWQSFSTAPNETVNFNQPNAASITLNRVIGNEQSVLQGALNATGKVFLVNPNGVLISTGATVNTGGFLASTLNITDDDFNKGNYTFKGNGSTTSVTNLGTITVTDGGYVVLMGHRVSNQGAIVATKGTVSLNAGNKVTLNFNGNSLLSVTIDEGALNALVENKQAIYADGGQVILTAKAADELLGSQVNNTGIVQAQTIDDLKGTIEIYAHGGTANIAGKLDASAPTTGDGGFIETSGDKVKIADSAVITTKSATGKSGTWLIDPTDFTIAASGGDITGAALSAQLANNALVTIEAATLGANGINGDIYVNDGVSWSTDSILKLVAVRDININNEIKATGANAGLVMNYGRDYNIRTKASYSGSTRDAAGNLVAKQDTSGGVYGSVTLSGANASLNINGDNYTLIHDMASLAAINGTGKFALAQNLDAASGIYNGAVIASLDGTLAGMGHTISNLTINTPNNDYVGLVGQSTNTSIIRDLGLVNINIAGNSNVGGVVGYSTGSNVHHVYVSGTVKGFSNVGGVLGFNNGGSVISSYSTADVEGASSVIGGLVGRNFGAMATIVGSHVTGKVTAFNNQGISPGNVGGLAGMNVNATIADSYYAGESVTVSMDATSVGGLVGTSGAGAAVIRDSFVVTNVIGGLNSVGGFAGNNSGLIKNSSAVVSVSAGQPFNTQNIGGFVGFNGASGVISDFSVKATVTAPGNIAGGVAGNNAGSILNGVVVADVTVGTGGYAGGIAGINNGAISGITLSGSVSGEITGREAASNNGTITNISAPPPPPDPNTNANSNTAAVQQATLENVGQQLGSAAQSMQRDVKPTPQQFSTAEKYPAIDKQIVFADTQNFSADVKSIVVDGVRFDLEDSSNPQDKESRK